MIETRRNFLVAAASLGAALSAGKVLAQSQMPLPLPGQAPSPFPPGPIGGPMPEPRQTPAERMKLNQAQIKKDMARLKEVVGDLEKEFSANSTTTVLSITAVRKTEEIEKLAKDIRNLLRG